MRLNYLANGVFADADVIFETVGLVTSFETGFSRNFATWSL